jgi:hypothetical protein
LSSSVLVDKADTSVAGLPARTVEVLLRYERWRFTYRMALLKSIHLATVSVYKRLLRCKFFLAGSDDGSNASHISEVLCMDIPLLSVVT